MERLEYSRVLLVILAVLALIPRGAASGTRAVTVELEAGPVWQSRNDIEIPNDGTATRFSLVDLVGSGPYFSYRAYISFDFAQKHGVRLLLAPLTIEDSGTPSQPIGFEGETFEPGTAANATYRFNSFRLTYRYLLFDNERWSWRVGFTANIRDAEVSLAQGGVSASNSNVGFVPLLYLSGEWRWSQRLSMVLDADALAAPQGRAEDVAVKVSYRAADRWTMAVGYRLLEGGADVDDVYTFAWLHYAVVSVGVRL